MHACFWLHALVTGAVHAIQSPHYIDVIWSAMKVTVSVDKGKRLSTTELAVPCIAIMSNLL